MVKEVKGYLFTCIFWNKRCLRFITDQIPEEEIRINTGDGVAIKMRENAKCYVALADGNEEFSVKKGDYLILTKRSVRVMKCYNLFDRFSIWKNVHKYAFVIS